MMMPTWTLSVLSTLAGSVWVALQHWVTKFLTQKMLGKFIVMKAQDWYAKEKALALKTPEKGDDEFLKNYENQVRFLAELMDTDITDWKP